MKQIIAVAGIILILISCKDQQTVIENHQEETPTEVTLNPQQYAQLEMEVGIPEVRKLSVPIQTNGVLETPPNSEAVVTAIMASKVSSIRVIEGQTVKKGEVLAYLTEPSFAELQSKYLEVVNRAEFLEQEYNRQKKLFAGEAGSGKTLQQTESEYKSVNAQLKGLQQQLQQLGMNPRRIENGEFYTQVAAISPISGSVSAIHVKTGQYVLPEKELFEIVNTNNLFAKLQVYEKEMDKVRVGQRVSLNLHTFPDVALGGKVYSIGKRFEENPKAVYVYVNIDKNDLNLIPGMYIMGNVLKDSEETTVLPETAVVMDGESRYAFLAQEIDGVYTFKPVEVIVSATEGGWSAVSFKEEPAKDQKFALNNAYYLWAELKKGEVGDDH